MATLWIKEYTQSGLSAKGKDLQIPLEPAVATQAVTFTTSSQSAAFNAQTKYIGVRGDALAHLLFGSNPTATANHNPVTANETVYFGVVPGQKVAAYDGTS